MGTTLVQYYNSSFFDAMLVCIEHDYIFITSISYLLIYNEEIKLVFVLPQHLSI